MRYRKHLWFSSEAKARRHEERIRSEIACGLYPPAEPEPEPRKSATLAAIAATYVDAITDELAPSTVKTRAGHLRNHVVPVLGEVIVSAVDAKAFERLSTVLKRKGLQPSTRAVIEDTFVMVLNYAVDLGELDRMPGRRKRKRKLNPVVPHTPSECAQLVEAAPRVHPELADLLSVLLHAGLRIGEAQALQREDVSWESRSVLIQRTASGTEVRDTTKGGEPRRVPLSSTALDALQRQRQRVQLRSSFVFPGDDGEMLAYQTIRGRLERLCQVADVRYLGWHAMRHTFGAECIRRGIPIRTLQVWLGHKSVKITERYAHFSPELNRQIELLDAPAPSGAILGQRAQEGND